MGATPLKGQKIESGIQNDDGTSEIQKAAYTSSMKKDNPFRSSSVNRFGGRNTHVKLPTLEEDFYETKLPN